jgi:hypothetical protein
MVTMGIFRPAILPRLSVLLYVEIRIYGRFFRSACSVNPWSNNCAYLRPWNTRNRTQRSEVLSSISMLGKNRKKDSLGEALDREMETSNESTEGPPKLKRGADGGIDDNSLADLIEWFLSFDERTARMRHPYTEELFQWKQHDDSENGVGIYPFENAEARFAIGVFQALKENNSEPLLGLWLTDVLNALHESRETKREISEANKIDDSSEQLALERAEKLTTKAERRLYLTSCWLEQLCTAEARVLGWVYQEMYGKPFTPSA